jgi:hypothetical protein
MKKFRFPTRAQFNKWLKKQPGEKKFNFMDREGCLIAAFLRDYGREFKWVGGHEVHFADDSELLFPEWLNSISLVAAVISHEFSVGEFRQNYKVK